jgi:hypothetical protein
MFARSHLSYEVVLSIRESHDKACELFCEIQEVVARSREKLFQSHKLFAEIDRILKRR